MFYDVLSKVNLILLFLSSGVMPFVYFHSLTLLYQAVSSRSDTGYG